MPVSNQLSNDGVRQSALGAQRISGMAGILIKTSEWPSVPMPHNKKMHTPRVVQPILGDLC